MCLERANSEEPSEVFAGGSPASVRKIFQEGSLLAYVITFSEEGREREIPEKGACGFEQQIFTKFPHCASGDHSSE